MNKQEPRPEIDSTERESENFTVDYPSGLHCDGCMTEITRHEANENTDMFGRIYCIDCWEEQ